MISMINFMFGNPQQIIGFDAAFLLPDIEGWISLVILISVSIIAFLTVIRRMQKEEIH
jgi:hypothetical protein